MQVRILPTSPPGVATGRNWRSEAAGAGTGAPRGRVGTVVGGAAGSSPASPAVRRGAQPALGKVCGSRGFGPSPSRRRHCAPVRSPLAGRIGVWWSRVGNPAASDAPQGTEGRKAVSWDVVLRRGRDAARWPGSGGDYRRAARERRATNPCVVTCLVIAFRLRPARGGCRARCAAHAPDLPTASHMVNKANRRPGVGPAVKEEVGHERHCCA